MADCKNRPVRNGTDLGANGTVHQLVIASEAWQSCERPRRRRGLMGRGARVLRLDCHTSLATTRGGVRGVDWPVFPLGYLV